MCVCVCVWFYKSKEKITIKEKNVTNDDVDGCWVYIRAINLYKKILKRIVMKWGNDSSISHPYVCDTSLLEKVGGWNKVDGSNVFHKFKF
jgi:hypothetical protein